jgi:lactoylglutathione lyase
MKFGYMIIYVPNVAESLAFFKSAFGFSQRFLHESGDYGELETGETILVIAASESTKPLGFEVAFVTLDVAEAYETALSAGATKVKAPEAKPWGQIVAYVRCPDGTLVELCSPVGG